MPLDGMSLRALARELNELLAGGRVEKALQPEKDEIHLIIRSQYKNHRLVMSASANHPRVLVTAQSKANPLQAPMFCMLLRKRLSGAVVLSVTQPGMERILEMRLLASDELGVRDELTLRAELMGRHSNILLTDSAGRIVDCIKHITEEKSRVRETLPGLPYCYPPAQDKRNPLELDPAAFEALLEAPLDKAVSKHLADSLAGLALPTARALVLGALEDSDMPLQALSAAQRARLAAHLADSFARLTVGALSPVLVHSGGGVPEDFAPFPLPLYPALWQHPRDTLSAAMDEYYQRRDLAERMAQRTANMVHVVRQNLQRCQRKLAKQQESLDNVENMDTFRLYGELLTVHQQQAKKGMTSIVLENYYDPEGGTVSIPLDPARSAMENAQSFYTKYRKAQVASKLVHRQMEENEEEIRYLSDLELSLAQCTSEAEVQEIHDELVKAGYLRPGKVKGVKQLPPSKPLRFLSSEGYEIFVGRNNQQNDQLTLRTARKDDMWLHTQKIPGSHVIVRARDGEISTQALSEAAMLAAHFSKASASSQVPVDFTRRAYVKKPAGAKPGFVVYTPHQTLYVTPQGERMEAILARQVIES